MVNTLTNVMVVNTLTSVIVNTLTTSGAHVVDVVENAASGTFVGHVTVRDDDSGSNGRTSCSVTSLSADSPLRLEQVFDTEYQVCLSLCDIVYMCYIRILCFNQSIDQSINQWK